MGTLLMKADLQLSHYSVGREGQGVAKETSATAFKYCNSKIHCFVSTEEEFDTCQRQQFAGDHFSERPVQLFNSS